MLCWRVPLGLEKLFACCVQRWHGVRAWHLLLLCSLDHSNLHNYLQELEAQELTSINQTLIPRMSHCEGYPRLYMHPAHTVSFSKWFESWKLPSTGVSMLLCKPNKIFHIKSCNGKSLFLLIKSFFTVTFLPQMPHFFCPGLKWWFLVQGSKCAYTVMCKACVEEYKTMLAVLSLKVEIVITTTVLLVWDIPTSPHYPSSLQLLVSIRTSCCLLFVGGVCTSFGKWREGWMHKSFGNVGFSKSWVLGCRLCEGPPRAWEGANWHWRSSKHWKKRRTVCTLTLSEKILIQFSTTRSSPAWVNSLCKESVSWMLVNCVSLLSPLHVSLVH